MRKSSTLTRAASPIDGPIRTSTGGTKKLVNQAINNVRSHPNVHTLATFDINHTAEHAFSVEGGCSQVNVRSNVMKNSAASGALAAALAAIHPPNLAANLRASCSRVVAR